MVELAELSINALPSRAKLREEQPSDSPILIELQQLRGEVHSLRNALDKVDASRDAAIKQAEELHAMALRAFQDLVRDSIGQLKDLNLITPKEAAKMAEEAVCRLHNTDMIDDAESQIARAGACVRWIHSESLKAARRGAQPAGDLPAPRTKTDLSAMTIITTLKEEATEGRKLISMTSSKARDLLAGRWGGKKISRKVGRDVLRRVVVLCPAIHLGAVPGDLRGTLQLIGEGPELIDSEILDRPYRYHSPRHPGREGDKSPSMREIILKSESVDVDDDHNRHVEILLSGDYKIAKARRSRFIHPV